MAPSANFLQYQVNVLKSNQQVNFHLTGEKSRKRLCKRSGNQYVCPEWDHSKDQKAKSSSRKIFTKLKRDPNSLVTILGTTLVPTPVTTLVTTSGDYSSDYSGDHPTTVAISSEGFCDTTRCPINGNSSAPRLPPQPTGNIYPRFWE